MVATWHDDWQHFARLNRGAGRRLLTGVTGSTDTDPVPFVIWATALAATPLLLTAIRSTIRLSMTGGAGADEIFEFIHAFRAFYVFYGMLLSLLAAAVIWEGLLPDRADQEVMSVLPVRPMVLAAARLAGATRIVLLLVVSVTVPVAFTFGVASGIPRGIGPLLRIVFAHVFTIGAGMMSVFWTLVAIRALVVLIGRERTTERLASLLQAATLLLFVEAFVFLPGVMGTIVKALRPGSSPPFWCAPALWFTALYGWIAEGGQRSADVNRALAAIVVPTIMALTASLIPSGWLARRTHSSPARDRASVVTRIVKVLLAFRPPSTAVTGMTIFAAATLARSRRHALLLASYTGMAIAMASIGLLTAGFTDRLNVSVPRRDVLAVPLVVIFFVVFGFRAALSRPADPVANWIFRIAPPGVADARRAARLLVVGLGVIPVLGATALTIMPLWGPATALKVLALNSTAAFVLVELAFARWSKVPCGSLHAPAGDSVKSRWPLIVLFLYLFAFRGADIQMYALTHGIVWPVVAVACVVAIGARAWGGGTGEPMIDLAPDGLSLLHLSGSDA